jgi:hypothetical protein
MTLRYVGVDDVTPRLPQGVITASQGTAHTDLAPGDVEANAKAYTDAAIDAARTIINATYVYRAGDTMTGPLIVQEPTLAGAATTKQYVDAAIAAALAGGGGGGGGGAPNWPDGFPTYDPRYVNAAGDTLTGDLIVDDSSAKVTAAAGGNLRLNAPAGQMVRLMTGDTTRFTVADTSITAGVPLWLNADPVGATEATTKQYVDALATRAFTSTVNGAVPAPVTIGGKVLRDDGTWYTIPQATTAVVGLTLMASAADVTAGTTSSAAVSPLALRDGQRQVVVPTGATSGSVAASNENQLVQFTASTAITLTIPTNATAPIPVGFRMDVAQTGAGRLTLSPAGGVTLTATPSATLRATGSAASLVKVATNAWLLVGDLA